MQFDRLLIFQLNSQSPVEDCAFKRVCNRVEEESVEIRQCMIINIKHSSGLWHCARKHRRNIRKFDVFSSIIATLFPVGINVTIIGHEN